MFRIPVFFMTTLLLFSTTSVGLAQQNSIQAQAEADALRDINRDMTKSLWFMSGLVGSSVGCPAGAIGAFLCGAIVDFSSTPNCISFLSDDPLWACTGAGAIVLGVLTVPAAIFIYPHNPSPPLERLLGKPPEYIEAYLQTYRSKTVSLRRELVTAGSITANVCIAATLLLMDGN